MFPSNHPLHYETGTHPRHAVFLNTDEYGRALDAITKACTDLLIVHPQTGKVLLGKRKVHPQPDWWYGCGGRTKPGESPYESAARLLKRELNIDLDKNLIKHVQDGGIFEGIGCYSYAWEMRDQPPYNHGTADFSMVLTLVLDPGTNLEAKRDQKEYEQHDWFTLEDVVADETKHPALRQSVSDLIGLKKIKEIAKYVDDSNISDEELGKIIRSSGLFKSKHNSKKLKMV
jgi:ADP-ribose pyrophosphatase YjhB (NUDIX family)